MNVAICSISGNGRIHHVHDASIFQHQHQHSKVYTSEKIDLMRDRNEKPDKENINKSSLIFLLFFYYNFHSFSNSYHHLCMGCAGLYDMVKRFQPLNDNSMI